MLLTALPPAPPTPNTIMRAFISRISVMSVIFASRLLRRRCGMRRQDCYPRAALRSDSTRVAARCPSRPFRLVDRAIGAGTGPQDRHLPFKPRRRLPGCRGLGGRLQQLGHQAIGALAFALEIGAVTGCRWLRAARSPPAMPRSLPSSWATSPAWRRPGGCGVCLYFSEINAHQGFAVIRKRARQAGAAWQANERPRRDVQAGAESGIGQNLNGHRLFSSNEPAVIR